VSIPFDDRGLLLGDGLFETVLGVDGRLVWLDAHLERLEKGCATLGLPAPDRAAATRLMGEALAGVQAPRAAVRLTLTCGSGGRGLDRPVAPAPRLFATAAPSARPEAPARLVTAAVRRNETSPASRLKTLSYLDNVLAREAAREAGADEALMLNTRGEAACAAAANIFWVDRGRLVTPAIACGALPGIMRAAVVAAARGLGLEVIEAHAPPQALAGSEGVFLTNSLIGVRPVAWLDGRDLPQSPMVERLASALD
jgi:branched-chain amino acid aminotransferase/4-amino-4-deoxychorismate lyase